MALNINIHIHHHSVDEHLIIKKLDKMAGQSEELLSLGVEIKSALGNLGDDITRLTNSVEQGNISDSVIQEFRDISATAKALADRTPDAPVVVEPLGE